MDGALFDAVSIMLETEPASAQYEGQAALSLPLADDSRLRNAA